MWRFKSSYFDRRNGDISLTYLDSEGNSKVLETNAKLEEHNWPTVKDETLIFDARKRIQTLLSR